MIAALRRHFKMAFELRDLHLQLYLYSLKQIEVFTVLLQYK